MRDIRGDLRERVNFLEEEIKAARTDFDRHLEELRQEHAGKLKELKANLEAVNTLMGAEHRRLDSAPSTPEAEPRSQEPKPTPQAQAKPQAQPAPPRQAPSQMRLTDFLMRKLAETGALSKDGLCQLAVQAHYFPDVRGADAALQETLTQMSKAGFIRQLPTGNFALPAVTDMIRMRRAG